MKRHLIIFARAPRLGRVKSRLAKEVGMIEALRLHRLLTMHLLEKVAGNPMWQSWIWVTPEPAIWPRGIYRKRQAMGNIGHRMDQALRTLPVGPVVLVGTDIPDLNVGHIRQAFTSLQNKDVVFGPAEDGGFWLIGLRRRVQLPHLFDGVRWSSEHALTDTVANLGQANSYAFVDTLADIDDVAALTHWKGQRLRPLMRALS